MKKIVACFALAMAVSAMGELRFGTVNMVDLVRLHPSHESNKALVKSTDKDYKAKLQQLQEAAKAIAEEGKKLQEEFMNPMLSAAAKGEVQKKMDGVQQRFVAARQELETSARHYQNELQDLEARLLKLETDDIRAKIGIYAKENGYDVIGDASMLAFAKESLDVTDAILKAMNVDPAKRVRKTAETK